MGVFRNWYALIVFCLLASYCSDSQEIKPVWQGTKRIELKRHLSIGTNEVEGENSEFGVIGHISIGPKGYIYVVDTGLFQIKKFSPEGEFRRAFGKGHGLMDGQFMRPKRIAFDSSGNLYALDFERRNVTVFDSIGIVLDVFDVPMMPSHIVIDNDDHMYIIGDPRSYQGPLIHKYKTDGSFVASFCDREGIHELALESGNYGCIDTDKSGNLYYSLPYPYEIRKFTSDGDFIRRFSRPTPEFKAPFVQRRNPVDSVWMPSGTMDLLVMPTGDVIQLVYLRDYVRKQAYPNLQLDLLSPDGDWLLNVPFSRLGFGKYGPMALDDQGNLYVGHADPYPTLVKYHLSLLDIEHQ